MRLKHYDLEVAVKVYCEKNNLVNTQEWLAQKLNESKSELEVMVDEATIEEAYTYLENICKLFIVADKMKVDYLSTISKSYLVDAIDSLTLPYFSDQDFANAFAYVSYTPMELTEVEDILTDVSRVEQTRAVGELYKILVHAQLRKFLVQDVCESIKQSYVENVALTNKNIKVHANLDQMFNILMDTSEKVESFDELRKETLKEKESYIIEVKD